MSFCLDTLRFAEGKEKIRQGVLSIKQVYLLKSKRSTSVLFVLLLHTIGW